MILAIVAREALNEEVALLLGVFESKLVTLDISLTLNKRKERLHV